MIAIVFSLAAPAIALDYSNTPAVYIPELAEMTQEELNQLSGNDAEILFGRVFDVPTMLSSDEQIRTALASVRFAMLTQPNGGSAASPASIVPYSRSSTTYSHYYTRNDGVAWVRDTVASPLTVGEALAGYIKETDYISRETAAIILASGKSMSDFEEIVGIVFSQGVGAYYRAKIMSILGLEHGDNDELLDFYQEQAVHAAEMGWSWYCNLGWNAMNDVFEEMTSNQVMRVTLHYDTDLGYAVATFEAINRPNPFPNPDPGKYGYWYDDEYAVTDSYRL